MSIKYLQICRDIVRALVEEVQDYIFLKKAEYKLWTAPENYHQTEISTTSQTVLTLD
jgi:hypothetical protein